MSRRCLIVGCSRTKVDSPQYLPAIQRYDGPAFRVIRRYLNQAPEASRDVDVFVLSAEFGLISATTKIPSYDRPMTRARAAELRPSVLDAIRNQISPEQYGEVFLSMGRTYVQAFEGLGGILGADVRLIISDSASGKKLSELRRWLWGDNLQASRDAVSHETTAQIRLVAEEVVLRGRCVQLTTGQALEQLRLHIEKGAPVAFHVRDWYLDIDDQRVSPKWAAGQLFAVPVREFAADEARRALKGLGLSCHRVSVDA